MKMPKHTSVLIIVLIAFALLFWGRVALAEEQDLAKASQNPVSSLISVPFENISSFNNGPNDAYVNTLLMKPVLPVNISENWNLIKWNHTGHLPGGTHRRHRDEVRYGGPYIPGIYFTD